jgi:glycosyltransferase involved in cell wall biosynthesis
MIDNSKNDILPLNGVKIARISTVPFFVLTQLKEQIEFLEKLGATVTIITSPGPEISKLESIPGVEVIAHDIPREVLPIRNFIALFRLMKLFSKRKFDIIHSTTPMAGLLTSIAAFTTKNPLRLHTFTGQRWVDLNGPRYWSSKFSDIIIARLNTLCYVDSLNQKFFLVNHKIAKDEALKVIGHGSLAGVNIHRFNQKNFNIKSNKLLRKSMNIPFDANVLLFVGRINIDKGIKELILAFAKLKKSGSDAHLILVGPMEDKSGLINKLVKKKSSFYKSIHLIGSSSFPEKYMAISDILCLPSYREGFGTVVIEAASMGIPTIGTNIYGLSDAIIDGETGILVPLRDSNALFKALEFLLSNKDILKKMGNAALLRSYNIFSADKVNLALVNEYKQLLINNRKK